MPTTERIGIIGGNGWMGNALAAAAVTRGFVAADALVLSSRSDTRGAVAIPAAHWTKDNAALAGRCDVVVLSVRPDQFDDVVIDARGKLVVSVMAAVPVARIAERTGADRIVRALPNAAASIGKSFTPWFATGTVTDADKRLVRAFFACSGTADEVPQESHVDYCVGMTGSGAAFPALLAQAMIEHAVAQGLPPGFARRAAQSVLVDAGQLLAASDDPVPIVQDMIDYRGTTAAALLAMIGAGFKDAVSAGLAAAAAKATVMAKR